MPKTTYKRVKAWGKINVENGNLLCYGFDGYDETFAVSRRRNNKYDNWKYKIKTKTVPCTITYALSKALKANKKK